MLKKIIKADGTDGIYADKQAEAELTALGHQIHFYRGGGNACWLCGRYARLDFEFPGGPAWCLSGAALEDTCEWDSVPYREIREGDYLVLHSVNGATYQSPKPITRLTKTQMVADGRRYLRGSGKEFGGGMTALYVSAVRRKP